MRPTVILLAAAAMTACAPPPSGSERGPRPATLQDDALVDLVDDTPQGHDTTGFDAYDEP
jgi:hypothetical protein